MNAKHKTRVLLLGPSLTGVGGVTTHVRVLLGSHLADRFDLTHFEVGSEGRSERSLARVWRLFTRLVTLSVVLARKRPDIVHLNTSLNTKAAVRDMLLLGVARLAGTNAVMQVHGGAPLGRFVAHNKTLGWCLRHALRSAQAVVVLSQTELGAYRAWDPSIKLHLVPNAVDESALSDQARSLRSHDTLRLLYLGRLVESKGVFEAIEALVILNQQGRSVELSLAGAGPDEMKLRARVAEAGLDQCVRFLGPVFDDEKRRALMDADVFVFPTHQEALPYALLEALAAGCVPVSCPVGAIPEVMQDGIHGLLVPPVNVAALAEALAKLDDDRASIVRMAVAGASRVRQFYTTERLSADLGRLYASL